MRSSRVLEQGQALAHPWVTGELALGPLRDRAGVLQLRDQLPQAVVATAAGLIAFIEHRKLFGVGVGVGVGVGLGYVDPQLRTSTRLTEDAELWTRDRWLLAVAQRLGLAHTR